MPIGPELHYFYTVDWPQVSRWIQLVRAEGCCKACARPHGQAARHPRRRQTVGQAWRDGGVHKIPSPSLADCALIWTTMVVLIMVPQNYDPGHCGRQHCNSLAPGQRGHLLHDLLGHRRRIRASPADSGIAGGFGHRRRIRASPADSGIAGGFTLIPLPLISDAHSERYLETWISTPLPSSARRPELLMQSKDCRDTAELKFDGLD